MNDIIDFAQQLALHYNIQEPSLHPLAEVGKVYRVEHEAGPPRVVRLYSDDSLASVRTQSKVLRFLEDEGFPAERVVLTMTGDPVALEENQAIFVTEWVDGSPVRFDWRDLYALGETVGRLHSIPLEVIERRIGPLPMAGMLPRGELAFAGRCLSEIQNQVPATLQPRYEELLVAVEQLSRLEELPLALIHNDCHPSNAVVASTGSVHLVDWEGTECGHALLDFAFLLSSIHPDARHPRFPRPVPERIRAVVESYRKHRTLSEEEKYRLPDAIRFRTLVLLSGQFARAVREPVAPDECLWGFTLAEWQARYDSVDEIVELAIP